MVWAVSLSTTKLSPRRLTPGVRGPGIRGLVGLGKRQAPSPIQRPTSRAEPPRLPLKAFRGEPAISGFAWHFTPTHSSSEPFATDTGSALHPELIRASAWPWVAHPVSGRRPATHALFGLAFAPAPRAPSLSLATERHSPAHASIGTPSPPGRGAPTACGHAVSGSLSLPSRGTFHRSLTVLSAIGAAGYLALEGGPPRFPRGSA